MYNYMHLGSVIKRISTKLFQDLSTMLNLYNIIEQLLAVDIFQTAINYSWNFCIQNITYKFNCYKCI